MGAGTCADSRLCTLAAARNTRSVTITETKRRKRMGIMAALIRIGRVERHPHYAGLEGEVQQAFALRPNRHCRLGRAVRRARSCDRLLCSWDLTGSSTC